MPPRTEHTAWIQQTAFAYGVRFEVLEAMVLVESSGQADAFRFEPAFYRRYIKNNPTAKAAQYGPLAACSYGLLQIMLEVAYEEGYTGRPEGLFVPRVGLAFGAKHFAGLLTWAGGDERKALAAYNGGKGATTTIPYRTEAYVVKVFDRVVLPGSLDA